MKAVPVEVFGEILNRLDSLKARATVVGLRDDYGMSGEDGWRSQMYHLPPCDQQSWLWTCRCGWSKRYFDRSRMNRSEAAHRARCKKAS